MNFVAIDFETANHDRNSACSVGLVRVKNGKITDKVVHLIRPPTSEFFFTYIHGISWDDVANAPEFGKLWPKIEPMFKGIEFLAAHNASFDKGVLEACCKKHRIPMPKIEFQCSMLIARRTWALRPTKLSDVCRHLKIKLNHHEALSDAHACAQIVLAANAKAVPAEQHIVRRRPTNTMRTSSERRLPVRERAKDA